VTAPDAWSAGRARDRIADPTAILKCFVVLLCWLPANAAVAGAGGLATPAMMLALLCAFLWVVGRGPMGSDTGRQPVRAAVFIYGAAVLASFVAAATQPFSDAEASAADRGVVINIAVIGIAVLAADGIPTRQRLDDLLRFLVVIGSGFAVVGILQFTMSLDLTEYVELPLLEQIDDGYEAITDRSDFNRVAGTTLHPIEFSVVLTMLLPLALYLVHQTGRRRWWVATGLLATAIPMSVSRTGALAVMVVMLVMVPTWSSVRRRNALIVGLAFLAAVKVAIPGLLGTIRALFTSFGVDPSITSRRSDLAFVGDFVTDRPWFGRGFATLLPDHFDFLDNQYFLSLVETGIVGLLALVGVFLVAIGAARGARHRSADPSTRDLGQSLTASLCVPLVAFATFDFMSFPVARGLAFLLAGCAGALWRFECHHPFPVRSTATEPTTASAG
jgi:polysaccharide biosynthesis protein PslJ